MQRQSYLLNIAKGACSPRVLLAAACLAVITSIPFFFAQPSSQPGQYSCQLQLTADTRSIVQVFFDLGRGFQDRSSARRTLEPTPSLTPNTVSFSIPTGRLQRIRINPVDRDAKFALGALRIVNASGQVLIEVPPEKFSNAHDIEPDLSASTGSEIHYSITKASDNLPSAPRIDVPLSRPIDIPPRVRFGLADRLLNCLPVFSLAFLGTLFAISAFIQAVKTDSPATAEPTCAAGSDCWNAKKTERTLWVVLIGLTLFKLWLVAGQTVHAIADAPDDDQLFINLSHFILGGNWLGDYDTHTLMKGSMYSVFIAGVFLLGIPLFTAQHILYAACCSLVVRALRPFRLNHWLLVFLFATLLFNPVTYETGHHTRVLRQHLLNPLALAIVASGIGLFARRQMGMKKMLPWTLLSGIALPVFWMTREEGVWILPACAVLWGMLLFTVWRERGPVWRSRIMLCCFPFVLLAGGVLGVSWLNAIYYKVFTTCEVKHPAFKAAYGALLRITPKETGPGFRNISIHREVMERAFAVSPAFASLRAYWEARNHRGEIADANIIWDFRNAVFDTGIATDGRAAMAFYDKVAREINGACDKGLVSAGSRRTGFLPPWTSEYTQLLPGAIGRAGLFFVTFDQMSITSTPSVGAPDELMRFIDMTRSRITPPEGSPPIPKRQLWLDDIRNYILGAIQLGYQHLGLIAGVLSLAAFFGALGINFWRRSLSYFTALSTALLGSCGALVLICSLVDTISFPAINTMYLSAGYGLWLLFLFTSGMALFDALQPKPTAKDMRVETP